jgi:RNA polymerase sigma-70 factor (ECF subfamily)
METQAERDSVGLFDERYRAYLETMSRLRPSLHRYCARMVGSVMDGEDVAQESLFEAYQKLDTFDESLPLKPWLFRIAHNRSIDFLRKQKVRAGAETESAMSDDLAGLDSSHFSSSVRTAVEHLVIHLPPMERACVLLKDVLDYSLEEIAELVDSTAGGVKSALSRARTKLKGLENSRSKGQEKAPNPPLSQLLQLYVDRFNQCDWDGVRELTSADARLLVADGFAGRLADAPYFSEYERRVGEWRMSVGEVDGEPVIIDLRRDQSGWKPHSMVRIEVVAGRVTRIADYVFCPWLLSAATSVQVGPIP